MTLLDATHTHTHACVCIKWYEQCKRNSSNALIHNKTMLYIMLWADKLLSWVSCAYEEPIS